MGEERSWKVERKGGRERGWEVEGKIEVCCFFDI
jgi:hypothetical protein